MGAGASVSPRSRSGRILLTSNGLSTPEITLYFMKQVSLFFKQHTPPTRLP
jgi:hypothetical protein